MENRNWKEWFMAAGIRALKTVAQAALAYITIGMSLSDIDWKMVLSTSIVAGVYSFITSLAGLPELAKNSPEVKTDELE